MARRTTTPTSTVKSRNRVFVDTGGWYAVSVENDRFHDAATRHFQSLLDSGASLLTSDYILDETLTRIRYDGGHSAAMEFWQRVEAARQAGFLTVLRVDEAIWHAALQIFQKYHDQQFSFTDCTSFVLAQAYPVDAIFAFDDHFRIFGFIVQPGI